MLVEMRHIRLDSNEPTMNFKLKAINEMITQTEAVKYDSVQLALLGARPERNSIDFYSKRSNH